MGCKYNKRNMILFILVIIIIVSIIIIQLIRNDVVKEEDTTEKNNGNISVDSSNKYTYISPEEEYDIIMNGIAAEYKEAAEDIKQNTSVDENGTILYYKDYMISDYEDLDINEIRESSLKNRQILESNFEGTDLYCLLLFAIKDKYKDISEIFICNNDNVETIKPGFIYRCHVSSSSHTATILIDVSNCKVHIEKSE